MLTCLFSKLLQMLKHTAEKLKSKFGRKSSSKGSDGQGSSKGSTTQGQTWETTAARSLFTGTTGNRQRQEQLRRCIEEQAQPQDEQDLRQQDEQDQRWQTTTTPQILMG